MLSSTLLELTLNNGIYFITICTYKRVCRFCKDIEDPYQLSITGQFAKTCWLEIPNHFPNVAIDQFIVMPNHLHGIIAFTGNKPFQIEKIGKPVRGSLSTIVRSYKSAVTYSVNKRFDMQGTKLWQPSFYEHRIRDLKEFHSIRKYIQNNPAAWTEGMREIL